MLGAAPLFSAVGCEREGRSARNGQDNAQMGIGAYFSPGTYWMDIAHRRRWFDELDLSAERVDPNADFFDSYDQLVNGTLEYVGFGQFGLIDYRACDHHVVGFMATEVSNGAETLSARPGIERVRDLTGKRPALSQGTYLEYLWSVVARRAGLDADAVQIVNTPAERAHELLARREADAVFTWEPFATLA